MQQFLFSYYDHPAQGLIMIRAESEEQAKETAYAELMRLYSLTKAGKREYKKRVELCPEELGVGAIVFKKEYEND